MASDKTKFHPALKAPKRLIPRTPAEATIGVLILIAFWWLIALLVHNDLIVPSPWEVAVRLLELASTLDFWLITGASLLRILIGFVCGLAAGIGLAVLMHWKRSARAVFSPIIHVVRATPVVSFIIIALIWIKTPYLPSFIAFLMVLPVAWQNLETGLSAVDPKLLAMANVFELGRWRKIRFIYLHALRPYFFAAASTCMGLAWKSGVTAEVIARPLWAIGRQLDEAKVYLQTTDLFAWTITLIVISLLLEWLFNLWIRHMQRTRR